MNCDCGENAFTFTRITACDGKKYTYLVGRCSRTSDVITKKKTKCEFKQEQVLDVVDIPDIEMKTELPLPPSKRVENRTDRIKSLETTIETIKMCQRTGYPFGKCTNRILYLSKKLNIPPYIQEEHTIDEYCKIANYYLHNPPKIPVHKPFKPYSLIEEISDNIDKDSLDYLKQLLTINRPKSKQQLTKKAKKMVYCANPVIEFRTGGLEDNEDEPQEDELDIEQFDSEEEQDDYENDYTSD